MTKYANFLFTVHNFYFQSLNGVFVNGERLCPNVDRVLLDGDVVQVGVPESSDKEPEFQWQFYKSMKVKKIKKDSQVDICSQASTTSVLSEKSNRKRGSDENSDRTPKRARVSEQDAAQPGCSKQYWSPSTDMARKLEEQKNEAAKKMKQQEAQLAEMQKMLKEKEDAEERMKEQLREKERAMQEELQKQQVQPC